MPTTLLSLNLPSLPASAASAALPASAALHLPPASLPPVAPENAAPPNGGAPGFALQPVARRFRISACGIEVTPAAEGPAAGASLLRSRALVAYPSEHYPFWNTVRAQFGAAGWADRLPWGALGEHLTLYGWLESEAWIGDLMRFPDCTLAVSEPRNPPPGLAAALGFAQAGQAMATHAWSGFYLAVRVPGTLAAGEDFEVIPGSREINIAELFRARRGA